MKKIIRLNLIKEVIYYTLGILLISCFVYLYWSHFRDIAGPPTAQLYIMHNWGKIAAIVINASLFLLFILFLPFGDQNAAGFLGMDKNSQIKRSRYQWDISIHPSSPIYGYFSDYHRLDVSLANSINFINVSDFTYSLLQACKKGRTILSQTIWRCVPKL